MHDIPVSSEPQFKKNARM